MAKQNDTPSNTASYFDGTTIQLIGWRILCILLTGITLGLAYPWANCMLTRWEINHTVINGRRLRFTGRGHQFFGRYLLWLLLTVVTFGIYGFWFGLGVTKWKVKHTVYEDDESGIESRFTGSVGGWLGQHLLSALIIVVTLGLGKAAAERRILSWKAEHTEIGGSPLVFSGTGGQLFVKYLLLWILTPLTLGIYALLFPVKLLRWKYSCTEASCRSPLPKQSDETG
ncbi:MAG: DUF898 domain-containing protein, partial [Lachnospiraceae bacterium]|nr:DUF898 domain-containing protein [Lachnospiraceae bacterium]